jgi:hypothetical protein
LQCLSELRQLILTTRDVPHVPLQYIGLCTNLQNLEIHPQLAHQELNHLSSMTNLTRFVISER